MLWESNGNIHSSIVVSSGYNGYGSQGKWNKVINDVKSKYRICVYDRAGMGKSDRIIEPYSYKKSAIRLKELLNNAGGKPPYIPKPLENAVSALS